MTGVGREYLKAVTAFDEENLETFRSALDPVLKRGMMDEQIAQLCDSAALRCYKRGDIVGAMAYYSVCDYQRFEKEGHAFGVIFTELSGGELQKAVTHIVENQDLVAGDFLPELDNLMKGDPSLKEEVEAILVLIAETQIKIGMHPNLILVSFKGLESIDVRQIIVTVVKTQTLFSRVVAFLQKGWESLKKVFSRLLGGERHAISSGSRGAEQANTFKASKAVSSHPEGPAPGGVGTSQVQDPGHKPG